MFRPILGLALFGGLVLVSGQSVAQSCPRTMLLAAVDSYVTAQEKGDPAIMALASPVKYVENHKDVDMKSGIIETPEKIDFHRSLLDTEQCETFTEVIITDPAHPYVLGTNLRLKDGKIVEIHTLVTDKGDWLFSPKNDLEISPEEDWSVIPADKRDTRETLIAGANAYFDYFDDKTVKVPWGYPCRRLEGGLRTGKGKPDDTCAEGVPSGVKIVDRHFVVDPDIGAVVGLVTFGNSKLPDSHLFRYENGKFRYIHTITVCSTFNCGFKLPDALKGQQN
jgi:hypothetical protein